MSIFGKILRFLFGVGKRKAEEAVEEVVDEVTELVGEKIQDIFGTYVIERRTSGGEAVRRYEDGSVRIGKRLVTEPTKKG
jgi:hypothetical protein